MYRDIDICYIGYITVKKTVDCKNIYNVNPLYLIIGKVDGHIEEHSGNIYFSFWFYRWKQWSIKKYIEL